MNRLDRWFSIFDNFVFRLRHNAPYPSGDKTLFKYKSEWTALDVTSGKEVRLHSKLRSADSVTRSSLSQSESIYKNIASRLRRWTK